MKYLFQPKFFLVLVLMSYLGFGLVHLTQFVTADEHYWVYERIPQYWQALSEGKWKKTFINDKPGISLALVSGVGTLLYPQADTHCVERDNRIIDCDTSLTEPIYLAFRLPLLIWNTLLLILLFWLVTKLANPWVALYTTALTALSPIILGISQIINPDALLWSFSATALFSFFVLLRFEQRRYLFLTIVLTAFAILSKYVAIILIPFYLALILFRFLTQGGDSETLHQLLKRDILSWFSIVAGTTFLVCFFLPALLVDSKYLSEFIMTVPDKEVIGGIGALLFSILLIDTYLLKSILLFKLRTIFEATTHLLRFSSLFFLLLFLGLIIARNFFPDWSIFTAIAFDIKDLSDARYYTDIPNFFESFLLEWNPVVFSLTPLTLIGFLILILFLPFHKESRSFPAALSLLFFFLVYTLLLIYSNILSTPRYSIMLYPLFAYLSALGLEALIKYIRLPHKNLLLFGVLSALSFVPLFQSLPFYFNYTNVLLPKSAMIQDAWGYGGYEAAQYLNHLPDAENLTVWADYYGVCEFFIGHCLTAYTFDKEVVQPDYYVLTRRGAMRYLSRAPRWERLSGLTAYQYYGDPNPQWSLFIGDRPGNYIKVYRVK